MYGYTLYKHLILYYYATPSIDSNILRPESSNDNDDRPVQLNECVDNDGVTTQV